MLFVASPCSDIERKAEPGHKCYPAPDVTAKTARELVQEKENRMGRTRGIDGLGDGLVAEPGDGLAGASLGDALGDELVWGLGAALGDDLSSGPGDKLGDDLASGMGDTRSRGLSTGLGDTGKDSSSGGL